MIETYDISHRRLSIGDRVVYGVTSFSGAKLRFGTVDKFKAEDPSGRDTRINGDDGLKRWLDASWSIYLISEAAQVEKKQKAPIIHLSTEIDPDWSLSLLEELETVDADYYEYADVT